MGGVCTCARFVERVLLFLVVLAGVAAASASAQTVSAPQSNWPGFQEGWRTGTPVDVTGEVTVLYADDFANRRAERLYFVKDKESGRVYQVRFDQQPKTSVRTGNIVHLSGRASQTQLFILADQTDSSSSTAPSNKVIVPAATSTSSDQRTLVMVANFNDASVSCSNSAINDAMFADPSGLSVNALYTNNSVGQVSLSGEVVGPFRLNANSAEACDLTAWADAADAAASANGIDVSSYARKMYVMPPNMCPGAGFGTVGGAPSAAWVFTCHLNGVYAHEVGHNLGMDHAATPTTEYGDTTDPMSFGSDALPGVNAPHRQELNWLGANDIQVVSSDGWYDVAPLALDPWVATAPRAIVIAKADTQEKYYLSYRLPQGFDNFIDSSSYTRLSIHRYKGDGSSSKTFLLAALADGESFVDDVNGITVTQTGHEATHATARIHFTNPCVPGAPSASLSPPAQSGVAGSSLTYTLSLTNHDSATCAPTVFALNGAFPTGWTGNISPASLSVGAGTTAQAAVTLTSPSGAAAGTYQAVVNANDNATSVHAASVAGAYSVTTPCVASAPSIVSSPASQGAAPGMTVTYAVTITNRDGAGCPASTLSIQALLPVGWSGAPSPSTVSLGPRKATTVMVSVTSASAATPASYSVTARTADGSQVIHAASAEMTYTVQSPADLTAPTAPTGLTVSGNQKLKRIQLAWNASTDNVGVLGYLVSRNGAIVATVTGTGWSDPAYIAGSTYAYSVSAFDAAGNISTGCNSVTITVGGGGGGSRKR
jgi:uncharacterized membrane protein